MCRVHYGTPTERTLEDAEKQAAALYAVLNALKAKRAHRDDALDCGCLRRRRQSARTNYSFLLVRPNHRGLVASAGSGTSDGFISPAPYQATFYRTLTLRYTLP